jgi:hypothetical protein
MLLYAAIGTGSEAFATDQLFLHASLDHALERLA